MESRFTSTRLLTLLLSAAAVCAASETSDGGQEFFSLLSVDSSLVQSDLAAAVETRSDGFRFRTYNGFTGAGVPVYPGLGSFTILVAQAPVDGQVQPDPVLVGISGQLSGAPVVTLAPSATLVPGGNFAAMTAPAPSNGVALTYNTLFPAYYTDTGANHSPEPSTWTLMAVALGGALLLSRCIRRQQA